MGSLFQQKDTSIPRGRALYHCGTINAEIVLQRQSPSLDESRHVLLVNRKVASLHDHRSELVPGVSWTAKTVKFPQSFTFYNVKP